MVAASHQGQQEPILPIRAEGRLGHEAEQVRNEIFRGLGAVYPGPRLGGEGSVFPDPSRSKTEAENIPYSRGSVRILQQMASSRYPLSGIQGGFWGRRGKP